MPGHLGIALSGAGPTILVLATDNYEIIAKKVIAVINGASTQQISCTWKLLEPAQGGATVEHNGV